MSCNDKTFEKYPYVYSCCPEFLDGISTEFLQSIFKDDLDPEGYHIICGKCRKVYHIFKLGMKWTEKIATDEELAEFKVSKEKYLLGQAHNSEHSSDTTFTLNDIPKFICIVCKKGMFEDESFELKEKFIEDLNLTISPLLKMSINTVTKEAYIEGYNTSKIATNSCRKCTAIAQRKVNTGKYN